MISFVNLNFKHTKNRLILILLVKYIEDLFTNNFHNAKSLLRIRKHELLLVEKVLVPLKASEKKFLLDLTASSTEHKKYDFSQQKSLGNTP